MFSIPKWYAGLIILICILSVYLAIPTLCPTISDSKLKNIFPENKVSLGLDLRGGAYLLLEVDINSYVHEQMHNYLDQIKTKLRTDKVGYEDIFYKQNSITIKLASKDNEEKIEEIISTLFRGMAIIERKDKNILIEFEETLGNELRKNLMAQTLEIIRRRVDETGTKEIDLQIQGYNQILLQVPGLDDPNQIKRLLGKTAKLSFHVVDDSASISDALNGKVPYGSKILPFDDKEADKIGRKFLVVKNRAVMTGEMLIDAQTAVNAYNQPNVSFKFNNIGSKIFADVSSKNIGKMLAIVLDNKVISAPVIREPILGGDGSISGNFSIQSANELALLLRAGALPAPIHIMEERTVGPSLGADSIEAGKKAVIAGVLLVILFMFLFYGMFGLIANVALVINLFMILTALSLFSATLTLPGIAGMVLTLGMAVDANVLIFERVKEEMNKGRTPLASLESGYNLAFGTIFDSNLTTIIVAFILYMFGTGPVKGFAVTLTIGILCSMFTAISLTKLIIATWYRRRQPKLLPL